MADGANAAVDVQKNHPVRPSSRSSSNSSSAPIVKALQAILTPDWVLTGDDTASYTKGARLGDGTAVAVAIPGTIDEAVAVLQACVDAGVAVIPQGRNTGLTGGSVPRDSAGRPFVVLSLTRLDRIIPLDGGHAILALGGAGIADAAVVASSFGRESHSVLGSFFLNPTVGAGVALGSGGTQLRKGPVYTERVLYACVDANNRVRVVDTLGLALPPGVASSSQLLSLPPSVKAPIVLDAAAADRPSHDATYAARVCNLDGTVARFNADTHGPLAVRSEGKALVLASVHSTFPRPVRSETLWISCSDFDSAQALRKLCLRNPATLPSQLEYLNSDGFEVVDSSGRALCLAIRALGIGDRLRRLWESKLWIESRPGCERLVDRVLYSINDVLPCALPASISKLGKQYGHHLIVTLDSFEDSEATPEATAALKARLIAAAEESGRGRVVVCNKEEASLVKIFRFAAAPAFRTFCIGTNAAAGLSVDYALPKNYLSVPDIQRAGSVSEVILVRSNARAAPTLNRSCLLQVIAKRMRYSHFGCAVVHEDIAYSALSGTLHEEKYAVKGVIEDIGGRLPAEHGHGVEYAAPPEMQLRWQATDPTNIMNPGVGGTSCRPGYEELK